MNTFEDACTTEEEDSSSEEEMYDFTKPYRRKRKVNQAAASSSKLPAPVQPGLPSAAVPVAKTSEQPENRPVKQEPFARPSQQSKGPAVKEEEVKPSQTIETIDRKGKGKEIYQQPLRRETSSDAAKPPPRKKVKTEKRDSTGGQPFLTEFTTKAVGLYVLRKYWRSKNTIESASHFRLERQPENTKDYNAICVMFDHDHVGFVSKKVAGLVSPFIDRGQLFVEARCGEMLLPAKSVSDYPLVLTFYGHQSLAEEPSLQFVMQSFHQPPVKVEKQDSDEEMEVNLGPTTEESAHLQELQRNQKRMKRGENLFQTFFSGDEDANDVALLPACTQPVGLKTKLLKHQLQALRWMAEMEHPKPPESESQKPVQLWTVLQDEDGTSDFFNLGTKQHTSKPPVFERGGILADDMGLGKTLSTLALIRSDLTGAGIIDKPDTTTDDDYCNATLIVCPLSVIDNWKEQIRTHVGGRLTCDYHIYHGAEGTKLKRKELKKLDMSVLFGCRRRAKSAVSSPLIRLECKVDHEGNPIGMKKNTTIKLDNGKLFKIGWRRIVLDEAHVIRNRSTIGFKACQALFGERRWALTGTPLINAPNDLGALIAFTKICHPYHVREDWTAAIESKLSKGKSNDAASALLRAIVQSSTLRRTKETKDAKGQPIVQLPKISIFKFQVELDEETRRVYDLAHGTVKERVRIMMMAGSADRNYSSILLYMLRLRQLACATALCPQEFIDDASNRDDLAAAQIMNDIAEGKASKLTPEQLARLHRLLYELQAEDCAICMETLDDPRITPCMHVFCDHCVVQTIRTQNQRGVPTTCPMCRSSMSEKMLVGLSPNYVPAPLEEEIADAEGSQSDSRDFRASKARELIRLLRLTGRSRSLIFSQWTQHLIHLGKNLDEEGITWAQFDGSMSVDARSAVVRAFNEPHGPQCLLLTIASGGVGLNLSRANNVFLMDPWWQGQIEQQAIDRCYRIGQTKEVNVYQLVAKDTIEDKVLGIQDRKAKMIQQAFAGTKGAVNNRQAVPSRMDDILSALGLA